MRGNVVAGHGKRPDADLRKYVQSALVQSVGVLEIGNPIVTYWLKIFPNHLHIVLILWSVKVTHDDLLYPRIPAEVDVLRTVHDHIAEDIYKWSHFRSTAVGFLIRKKTLGRAPIFSVVSIS